MEKNDHFEKVVQFKSSGQRNKKNPNICLVSGLEGFNLAFFLQAVLLRCPLKYFKWMQDYSENHGLLKKATAKDDVH